MTFDRNGLLFLLLCAIWGTTWIGIKAGIEVVPPLIFAGTRFMTAGTILLSVAAISGKSLCMARRDLPRLVFVSLFMVALCYGPLFWGMLYIDSGTAAVLELSLTPIVLLCSALLLGEETFDRRRLVAIVLGVSGLVILFGPTVYLGWSAQSGGASAMKLWGAAAVASAALTYGWGSVVARPLLRAYPSTLVTGATTLLGGGALLATSLLFEPNAVQALSGHWGLAAWSGWLFLVLFGSLVGYSIYMRLLRDIGASRAGVYAFVSPVIAVMLGMALYGEELHILDVAGMLVMLIAAGLAMFEPKTAGSPIIAR
jgi:drug/metabolite transporter (DMT)-like permease